MMQVKKIFLLIGCFLLGVVSLQAQEIKINDEGKKIIVYEDGSWKYFGVPEDKVFPPDSNTPQATPKANQDEEFRARILALRKAEKVAREASRMEAIHQKKSTQVLFLKNELATMNNSKEPISQEKVEIMRGKLELAKVNEKQAADEAKLVKEEADFYEKLVYMNIKKREKALEKYTATRTKKAIEPSVDFEEEKVINLPKKAKSTQAQGRKPDEYAQYDAKNDVLFNPPKRGCEIAYEAVDELTGKKRTTTKKQYFFSYTRSEIRPYYKDREHIYCNASLTALTGGLRVLTLEILIADNTAQEAFGGLLRGSQLIISMMDGTTVELRNNKSDRGEFDATRKIWVFEGNYQLNPKAQKRMEEGEVDKVRVVWDEGYDTYEVHDLDFFKNQFPCLN